MPTLISFALLFLLLVAEKKSRQTSHREENCNQQIMIDVRSNIVGLALKHRIPRNDSCSQSLPSPARLRKLSECYLLRNIRHDCYHEYTFLRSDSNYAASIEMFQSLSNKVGCQRGLEVFNLFYIEETEEGFHTKSCLEAENFQKEMVFEWNLQRAIPKVDGDNYLEKFLIIPDIVQERDAFLGSLNEADESLSWVSHEKYADLYAYVLTTTVFTITICFWMFLTMRWLLGKLYSFRK